jgi:hypothetical protein
VIGHRTQGKSHVLKVLKGASSDETRSFLKELLRDAGIRRHLDGLTRRHGGGDFYAHRAHGLRMTRARLKNAGVQVRPEGDTAELHRPSAFDELSFSLRRTSCRELGSKNSTFWLSAAACRRALR